MNKAYRIPEDNLGDLQTRIGKLARRCKRIGVQGPVLLLNPTPEEVRKTNDLTGVVTVRRYFTVTIDSPERPRAVEVFEMLADCEARVIVVDSVEDHVAMTDQRATDQHMTVHVHTLLLQHQHQVKSVSATDHDRFRLIHGNHRVGFTMD